MPETRFPLLILLATYACGDAGRDDTPRARVVTRDSAAITIVESAAPRWSAEEAWTVDTVPALDLASTGSGPRHEFFRVADATRLPDGRIVVADGGSSEVRVYAADGRFLWASGGKGDGPGEFERLTKVAAYRGDSILAFDYWNGRLTILDHDGNLGRTAGPFDPEVRIRQLEIVADSLLAGSAYDLASLPDRPSGLYRTTNVLLRLSAVSFALIDSVTTYPGAEGFTFSLGDIAPIFAKQGHLTAHRGRMIVGNANAMEYRVYGAEGSLETVVRVPDYDLSLSDAEVDAELAPLLGPEIRPEIREAASAMPRPETRPAYQQLIADAEGNVWAAEYHGRVEEDAPLDWEVFSADGAWLGSVRTPPRFDVFEIGDSYVLGLRRTELDVERVQMLRLERN